MKKPVLLLLLPLLALLALSACHPETATQPQPSPPTTAVRDTLAYSFAVLGCNRIDNADVNLATNPSTANVPQLLRTYQDLADTRPAPAFVFMMGDLVLGYSPDSAVIGRQLRAWVSLYRSSALGRAGTTRLVALPGNHEVMSGKNQPAFANAESAWLRALAPYLMGSNGPTAGGPDQLATDQSRLTYSFDYQRTHFVVLNTDPVGHEGTVPTQWLTQDLAAARAHNVRHCFVLGHKPAVPAPANDGLSNGGTVMALLDQNHGEAMLAAHNHLYYRLQPAGVKAWQLIAGNGGSPLDATAAPNKLFFGYTLIKVFTSGRVMAYSYGRDLPASGYLGPTTGLPTTMRDSVDITWK